MSANPRLTTRTGNYDISVSCQVTHPDTTNEQYTYDANGNRASATVYGVTSAASYAIDNNLIVYGDNTYRYDDDGYLVEKVTPEGMTTYTYGTLGELREVQTPSKTIIYQHNANKCIGVRR